MQKLSEADLIINPDGSIYHLNLLPEDIADTVITVGDLDRVGEISKHFDSIAVSYTHLDVYKRQKLDCKIGIFLLCWIQVV